MLTLDNRTETYLRANNVALEKSAIDAAKDAQRTWLGTALRTGEPINPDVVHFLRDYYNDSTEGIDEFKKWLYTDGRMATYLDTVKGPVTEALAPLMCDLTYTSASDRETNLNKALANNVSAKLEPPAQAITALASTTTGKALAAGHAQTYIRDTASTDKPISDGFLDAYISLNPATAATFMADEIKTAIDGNHNRSLPQGCMDLLEAYRELNPETPAAPASYFDTAVLGAPPAQVKGWAYLATQALMDAAAEDRPMDPVMMARLQEESPFAAAYVADRKLQFQADRIWGEPNYKELLDPAALKALGNYAPDKAKGFVDYRMTMSLQPANYLLAASDSGASSTDGVTNDSTPGIYVDLQGMGVQPKVGDLVNLYDNGTKVATWPALTADDIIRGYIHVEPPTTVDGHHLFQTTLTSGTAPESKKSVAVSVHIDTKAPERAAGTGLIWKSSAENKWVASFQVNSGTPGSALVDYVKDPNHYMINAEVGGQNHSLRPEKIVVNELTGQLDFVLPASANSYIQGASAVYFGPTYASSFKDAAGNVAATPDFVLTKSPIDRAITTETKATINTAPRREPTDIDHRALEWLEENDPASAALWLQRFNDANLVGPVPPPPPPPPPPAAAPPAAPPPSYHTIPPLTAEDIAGIDDIDVLFWEIMGNRSRLVEEQIREMITDIQLRNEAITKLNTLMSHLNEMAGKVPAGIGENTKFENMGFSDEDKAVISTIRGNINHTISGIDGLILFTETADPQQFPAPHTGKFDGYWISKSGVNGAINKVRAEIEMLTNLQQTKTLNLQQAYQRYTECQTMRSERLARQDKTNSGIIGNMR